MAVNVQENMAIALAVKAAATSRKKVSRSLDRGFKPHDQKRHDKLVALRKRQSERLQGSVNELIQFHQLGQLDKALALESEIKSGLATVYEKTQPDSLACPPAEQIYYLMLTQIVADAGFERLLPAREESNGAK